MIPDWCSWRGLLSRDRRSGKTFHVKRQSPPLNRLEGDPSKEILFHVKHGHLLRDVSRETAVNLKGRLNHKTSFVAEPANDLPITCRYRNPGKSRRGYLRHRPARAAGQAKWPRFANP